MNMRMTVVAALAVAGCTSSSLVTPVTVRGEPGYVVRAGAMYSGELGPEGPIRAGIEKEAVRARTGSHGAGLPNLARDVFPNGYRIVGQAAPTAQFYMILATGDPSYKVYQDVTIVCAG
jgi:hypothetical protein